jgi:hypothetical protein
VGGRPDTGRHAGAIATLLADKLFDLLGSGLAQHVGLAVKGRSRFHSSADLAWW